MLHRLSVDDRELEAEELQGTVEGLGATRVADCCDRQRVRVVGVLRTVTLRPRAGVPALEAELWDGSAPVTLIWLGRRQIRGIEPGRCLVAHGRLTLNGGRRVIFNPVYDLRPSREC